MHVCPPGCCSEGAAGDPEKSRARALDLIDKVLLPSVMVPATNKWTKVAPVISRVALWASFHNLMKDAFKEIVFRRTNENPGSDISEGEQAGAPCNEQKTFRKLADRRARRASAFLSDPDSQALLLAWCAVSKPIMNVHYSLFNRCTWFLHRKKDNPFSFEVHDEMGHPGNKAMAALEALLTDPDGAGHGPLAPLRLLLGPQESWPQAVLAKVHSALALGVAHVWRHLIRVWQQYPWRLCTVVDDRLPLSKRKAAAQDFLVAKPCCLDPGLGKPLRGIVSEVDDLFEEDLQIFLRTMFSRAVHTSTFVERIFSHLTRWSRRRLAAPSMAAKHTATMFEQVVRLWRSRLGECRPAAHRARPGWLRSRGSRFNGYHVFVSRAWAGKRAGGKKLSTAAAWRALSAADRRRFCLLAASYRVRRDVVRSAPLAVEANACDVGEGPWQLSTRGGAWPLSRHRLVEALAGPGKFQQLAKSWQEDRCCMFDMD